MGPAAGGGDGRVHSGTGRGARHPARPGEGRGVVAEFLSAQACRALLQRQPLVWVQLNAARVLGHGELEIEQVQAEGKERTRCNLYGRGIVEELPLVATL